MLLACKISWSPSDSAFCVVLEDDPVGTYNSNIGSILALIHKGSPWGLVETITIADIFDEEGSGSSQQYETDLHVTYPFDFYAHWLPGYSEEYLLISEGVHVTPLTNGRMVQEILVDTRDDPDLDIRFNLIGSKSNYGRGCEIIKLKAEDTDVSKTCMAVMCGDNPYVTNNVYIIDISDLSTLSETAVDLYRCPCIDTRAAVLSIHANRSSHHHDYLLMNCRPFLDDSYLKFKGLRMDQCLEIEGPDVSNEVELRIYNASTLQHLYTFSGHHAFSLKGAIFFLYLDSIAFQNSKHSSNNHDSCNLIASGSEENNVYIWHRDGECLVRILRGHTSTASTVSFNPRLPGVLASGADDFSCKIWVNERTPCPSEPCVLTTS